MKNALILKGCISLQNSNYTGLASHVREGFVDYKMCADNIYKHIINPNPDVDIFIQTYSISLREELLQIYKPKAAAFTDDSVLEKELYAMQKVHPCQSFSQVCVCKSWEITVDVVQEYCINNNIIYDKILVYRPDLLINRNIILDDYDVKDCVFTNAFFGGDFHFVMSYLNFLKFKNIYKSIPNGLVPQCHFTHDRYIKDFLKLTVKRDKIFAGVNQEVCRKVPPDKIFEYLNTLYMSPKDEHRLEQAHARVAEQQQI